MLLYYPVDESQSSWTVCEVKNCLLLEENLYFIIFQGILPFKTKKLWSLKICYLKKFFSATPLKPHEVHMKL